MENVVNLEQLDYRDQLIKEYIDEHSNKNKGSQLFCELEVDTIYSEEAGKGKLEEAGKGKLEGASKSKPDEAHLYIKCYKGTILESDELQFARNTATPTWRYTGEKTVHGVPVKILVKKRRGWIIPKPYNLVRLYKVYAEEKSATSELYDYWEVLPKNRNDEPITWQELLDEFLYQRFLFHESKGTTESNWNTVWCGDSFANNYASFVNRWCGVAIKREDNIISDYMLWQISGCNYKSGSLISPYQVDGRYFMFRGKRSTAFYHFSLRH